MDHNKIIELILKNGIVLKGKRKVIKVAQGIDLFGNIYFVPLKGEAVMYPLSELDITYTVKI